MINLGLRKIKAKYGSMISFLSNAVWVHELQYLGSLLRTFGRFLCPFNKKTADNVFQQFINPSNTKSNPKWMKRFIIRKIDLKRGSTAEVQAAEAQEEALGIL